MLIMAKVLMFPQKKKLPKGVEERLYEVGKEYIEVLYAAMVLMDATDLDKPTYEEVLMLVSEAFADGINDAIDELGED